MSDNIMYAKRGTVIRSLEILASGYFGNLVDQKILAASRSAEAFLHRRFYPELRTISVDWPNNYYSPSWEFPLGDNEIIELVSVVSGGTDITDSILLRRYDDKDEPPYTYMQVDLSTNAAFSAGDTWQQSLVITALFGVNDTNTTTPPSAILGANINSSVTTLSVLPSDNVLTVDVGSLLLIGTERITVTKMTMADTGYTISADVSQLKSATSITTANATDFAINEVILINAERMRINDITATTLVVTRAIDGTTLGSHTSADAIYALRDCTVRRGVLGSTAASHTANDSIYDHEFPSMLTELVTGEAVVMLNQHGSGYGQTISSGAATRGPVGVGLDDLRERAWRSLGRKNRLAAI